MTEKHCPSPDGDCVQEETVKKLATQCDAVLQKLVPELKEEIAIGRNRIDSYSKVSFTFLTLLIAVAGYGFFELQGFKKDNAIRIREDKLFALERDIQQKSEIAAITHKVDSVKTQVSADFATVRLEIVSVKAQVKEDIGDLENSMRDRNEKMMEVISEIKINVAKLAK